MSAASVLAGSTLGDHHVALLVLCGRNAPCMRHITFIGVGSIDQPHLGLRAIWGGMSRHVLESEIPNESRLSAYEIVG